MCVFMLYLTTKYNSLSENYQIDFWCLPVIKRLFISHVYYWCESTGDSSGKYSMYISYCKCRKQKVCHQCELTGEPSM